MRRMKRLPLRAKVHFLTTVFGIGAGLYLSDMIVLLFGICMLIVFLAFLYDLNRGA